VVDQQEYRQTGPSGRRGRRLIIVDLMTTRRGAAAAAVVGRVATDDGPRIDTVATQCPAMRLMNGITEQRQANQTDRRASSRTEDGARSIRCRSQATP